jgi:hypothetical protein
MWGVEIAAMIESRRVCRALMKAASEAIREAKTGSKISIHGNSLG